MNEAINELFSLGARIRDTGLTPMWLVSIGILFGVTLVLSIREMSQWYLGVHRLRKDLEEIRRTLTSIQSQLAAVPPTPAPDKTKVHDLEFVEAKPARKVTFASPQPKASQNFPLQR